MDKLAYLLPVLGCAAMLGMMMWMMRGGHNSHASATGGQPDPATREEIAMLRAEIASLRAAQAPSAAPAEETDPVRWRSGTA